MANVTIPMLPVATSANVADLFAVEQSGVTKQLTNALLFTNATLVTPTLGTPASGTLTNCTGLPIATGVANLGAGVATFLATPSSANLAAAVTGETGSGALVFGTSPTLVTPTLGVAVATSINKIAITAPATSATLTIADSKTLTANNSLTLAGTDATTMTFPGTSATIARSDAAQTFTGNQTFSNAIVGSIQSLSGPGAVNITTGTTAFTSTGAGDALTLADGVAGQFKTIIYVAEAGGADTGVLTPTNFGNGTTITFTNVGDSVVLQFIGTDWWRVSINGATVA
jgi:hypothetical protein